MSRGVPTSVLPCLRLTSPFLSIVNANCPSLDHVEVAGRLRTMAHARTGSCLWNRDAKAAFDFAEAWCGLKSKG